KYKGPSTRTWRHAAILIPLCTAHGKPSVLLTRRSRNLRRHAGEIAFPGGSLDASDRDEVAAALRETHEEILVPPNHVEILGQFHPIPDRTYSILIHPILAHIHTPHSLVPETMPYSKDEVDEIFAVSLEELLGSPTETELLRGTQHAISNWTVQGNKIWGLTAWVLNDTINTVI
ncbi:NUDIX hydrolase domain-like protein, partial [Phlyctochytrium arcticum]